MDRRFILIFFICIASSIFILAFEYEIISLASCYNSLYTTLTTPQRSVVYTPPSEHPRQDFFKDIMGIKETVFTQLDDIKIKNYLIFNNNKENPLFYLKTPQGIFQAGYLYLLNLPTLNNALRFEFINKQRPLPVGTFSIVYAETTASLSPQQKKYVDIAALQAQPENNGAVFQVASNFNLLEFVNKDKTPETQPLTSYIHDLTQGPFAAISAAPGLIYRAYFLYNQDQLGVAYSEDGRLWRQSENNQINLLLFTPLTVQNGYLIFNDQSLTTLFNNKKSASEIIEHLQDAIAIGYHKDIQVTFGISNDTKHAIVTTPNQVIDQVYTAAADFMGTNAAYKNDPRAQGVAKALLHTAYSATLLSALLAHRKKVFLTLIGGGVFANDYAWILEALEAQKDLIIQSGLEVILIIYNLDDVKTKTNNHSSINFNTFWDRITTLVKQTKGSITRANDIKTV